MQKEAERAWPHSHSITKPTSSQWGTLSSNHRKQLLHLLVAAVCLLLTSVCAHRAHLSSHFSAQQQSTWFTVPSSEHPLIPLDKLLNLSVPQFPTAAHFCRDML